MGKFIFSLVKIRCFSKIPVKKPTEKLSIGRWNIIKIKCVTQKHSESIFKKSFLF